MQPERRRTPAWPRVTPPRRPERSGQRPPRATQSGRVGRPRSTAVGASRPPGRRSDATRSACTWGDPLHSPMTTGSAPASRAAHEIRESSWARRCEETTGCRWENRRRRAESARFLGPGRRVAEVGAPERGAACGGSLRETPSLPATHQPAKSRCGRDPWNYPQPGAAVMESRRVLTFEELIENWDGETAVIHRDRESGGWIFVCLHSTRRGPAGGGTRMKVYGTSVEALQDAMRLSAAMTRKLAVAGLPFGGGKAVIAVPRDSKRGAASRAIPSLRRSHRVVGRHLPDELRHEHW